MMVNSCFDRHWWIGLIGILAIGCWSNSSKKPDGSTDPKSNRQAAPKIYCLYFVALSDKGAHGKAIGCDDSLIPVPFSATDQTVTLSQVLDRQLSRDQEFYDHPESFRDGPLYNAFHDSDINVDTLFIKANELVVKLSGRLSLSGMCDAPRIKAQIRALLTQQHCPDDALGHQGRLRIQLNGRPLEAALSSR